MVDGGVAEGIHSGIKLIKKGDSMAKAAISIEEAIATGKAVEVPGPPWQPTWFDVGTVRFAAFGDRLLIVEDEFRSGYECKRCNGVGRVACDNCDGKGHIERLNAYHGAKDKPELRSTDMVKVKCTPCSGSGQVACPDCNGKGGILIVPDVSQRRPSTGRVVSTGDKVKYFKAGDNVLYSNFAGHAMDLERTDGKTVVRILHESEILAQVDGHLELRTINNQRQSLGI